MPLSWNEIKSRALAFSRKWEGESSERAEAQNRLVIIHMIGAAIFMPCECEFCDEVPFQGVMWLKGQQAGALKPMRQHGFAMNDTTPLIAGAFPWV